MPGVSCIILIVMSFLRPRITAVVLSTLLVVGVVVVHPTQATAQSTSSEPVRQLQSVSSVDPTAFAPSFLVVPKLDVATLVEPVGADNDGQMETPSNWRNAAWYQPGRQSGQDGHAVFAAHRDWSGNAGPFYNLHALTAGDNVFVSDGASIHVYTVTETDSFGRSADPQEAIFQNQNNPYITLITCEGQFLETADTYSDRRVVQAKLTHTFQ